MMPQYLTSKVSIVAPHWSFIDTTDFAAGRLLSISATKASADSTICPVVSTLGHKKSTSTFPDTENVDVLLFG